MLRLPTNAAKLVLETRSSQAQTLLLNILFLNKISIQDFSLWVRLPITGILIIGFMSLAFWLGRESEDDDILRTVKQKMQRLVGKRS